MASFEVHNLGTGKSTKVVETGDIFEKDSEIPYILKEKHCNKCIHTIIDTWQLHNDLIISMLMRSHYIHKCVHTMYFAFF